MEATHENLTHPQEHYHPVQLRVSYEVLAYVALLFLALVLRLAEIDTVPMSDREAPQALAAWQVVHPDAPGNPPVANSPITFWLQIISFTLLPGSEFSARLPGIIGGIILILMPLLFRQKIGREAAFLWSLILTTSTVAIAASRFADATVWSGIFVLALLWALWRHYETRQQHAILLAAAFGAALFLLSAPSAILLGIVLILAGTAALWWTIWSEPENLSLETPEHNILMQTRRWFAAIPMPLCLLVAASTIVLVATGFMLYPAGFSTIGEVFASFLRGFVQSDTPASPPFFAVLTLIFYELLLIIFAIVGFMLWRQNQLGIIPRFLAAWSLIGVIALLFYRGSTPGDALWLVIPLSGLTTYGIRELFFNRAVLLFWLDGTLTDDLEQSTQQFAYVKWLVGIVTLALLIMVTVHLQEIARSMLTLPIGAPFGETINMLMGAPYAQLRYSGIWFLMSLLILVVCFFVAASIWGNENTLQGIGLGLFFLMLLSGMGGGWNAAVKHVDEAPEFWHTAAVSRDMLLLRTTLDELAQRNTLGFPDLEVVVLLDEPMGITDNSIIAWLLRDYPKARFVSTFASVQQQPIILMSISNTEPNLGSTYVGQRFLLRTQWSLNNLAVTDFLAWALQRKTRAQDLPKDRLILWLRDDVFNASGLPARP
jgi:4-amino-4-deoxy-L-arabinose transferase-like glycosyltransferase